MAEKNAFRIREIGEIDFSEPAHERPEMFRGVILEGNQGAIRAAAKHLGADVVVASADCHDKLVQALKAAKVVIEMMERPSGIGPEVAAALDARCAKIDAALASLDQESGQ